MSLADELDICPACDGSGSGVADTLCYRCSGTGGFPRQSSPPAVEGEIAALVERLAELQLAAFLAGRGSVTSMKHGTRSAKPAPTMDEFRSMARTALTDRKG